MGRNHGVGERGDFRRRQMGTKKQEKRVGGMDEHTRDIDPTAQWLARHECFGMADGIPCHYLSVDNVVPIYATNPNYN